MAMGGEMGCTRRWAARLWTAAVVLALAGAMPLGAQPSGGAAIVWTGIEPPPGLVAPCDQFDPLGPTASTRIALDSRDLVHRHGGELRSFIETGSLGRVAVAVADASPSAIVLGISAIPEISRLSPYFGERLKGIALDVTVAAAGAPVRVVLDVRQVCARHFRSTFLYY